MQIINLKQARDLGLTDLFVHGVNGFGDTIMLGGVARAKVIETGKPVFLAVRPSNVGFLYGVDDGLPAPIYVLRGFYAQYLNRKSAKVMMRFGIKPHLVKMDGGWDGRSHLSYVAALAKNMGIKSATADVTPHIGIKPELKDFGRFITDRPQVAIMTGGFPGKELPTEKYQQIVDAMKDKVGFVHICAPGDPELSGVLDMRGKLSFFEQVPAAFAASDAFVCSEGGLMHICRAVGTRAVVADALPHPMTAYNGHTHIFPPQKLAKKVRGQFNGVMGTIPVDKMISALKEQLKLADVPIEPDIVDLTKYEMKERKIKKEYLVYILANWIRCWVNISILKMIKNPKILEKLRVRDWPHGHYKAKANDLKRQMKLYVTNYKEI